MLVGPITGSLSRVTPTHDLEFLDSGSSRLGLGTRSRRTVDVCNYYSQVSNDKCDVRKTHKPSLTELSKSERGLRPTGQWRMGEGKLETTGESLCYWLRKRGDGV